MKCKVFLIMSIFVVLCLVQPVYAGEQHGYDYMVKALKQFPYPYQLAGDQKLGVISGISPIYSKDKKEELLALKLGIITRDNQLVKIKVISDEISLMILLHEISPNYGKYKRWRPVILFPVFIKKSGHKKDFYGIYELDIVGRYRTKHDRRGDDPNKVIGYKNESYR